jgi:hypothetical protein
MEVRKIDVIVDKIMMLTDEDGYFSPNELRSAFSQQRDLQKVAGLTINQLEKHFFSKSGFLRVPSHLGKESVKRFINIAKTAYLHGRKLSFAEAEEIVEKQKPVTSVETTQVKAAAPAPAPVETRNSKGVILRKGVTPPAKPKPEPPQQAQPAHTAPVAPQEPVEAEDSQKIDRLVRVIAAISSPDGYFDPKDAYARVRGTGLSKRLSVIVSNLRLQGFARDDKLRIPASGGPEAIKDFINLAARLRRQKVSMSFDAALASLAPATAPATAPAAPTPRPVRAPRPAAPAAPTAPAAPVEPEQTTPEPAPTAAPEPEAAVEAPKPVEPAPEPVAEPKESPVAVEPEEDFKSLYEDVKGKADRLEGELSAYKDMCLRFMDMLKR